MARVEVVSPDVDLAPSPARWADALTRAEGVLLSVGERLEGDALANAVDLRAAASMSAGADHMDLVTLARRGIATATVGPVLAECTADLAFGLLLSAARRMGEGERAVRAGAWAGWTPTYMCGAEVHGATLGIVGMGRIGRAVARRARAFDMPILYHNRRRLPPDLEEGASFCPLDELLSVSDHVIVLLPSTPETRGLLNAERLGRMRETAVLVNAGRGDVLDLEALVDLLRLGWLSGVGLDVYPREPLPKDHPVLAFERVVALPHLGSASLPTRRSMAETAARALAAMLAGEPLPPGAVYEAGTEPGAHPNHVGR